MAEEKALKAKSNKSFGAIFSKYAVVFFLVILVVILSIVSPQFRTGGNFINILNQSSIYGILALGACFVIISRGIDIACGGLLAMAGVIMGMFAQTAAANPKLLEGEYPYAVAFIVCFALCIGFGALNGALVAFTGIPAFIATMGTNTITRGIALLVTKGTPVSSLNESITFLGEKIGGVLPMPVVIWIICIVVAWILLNYTSFGKSVFAIGNNPKAAEVSGINVKKNLTLIYVYAGIMTGVATLVFAGRIGSVTPSAADGYELTAIAAATIGGTSHTGGVGTIWGAVVGALVLGTLRNGLTVLAVNAYWQQIIEGIIIIVAVVADMRKNTKKK